MILDTAAKADKRGGGGDINIILIVWKHCSNHTMGFVFVPLVKIPIIATSKRNWTFSQIATQIW